MKKVFVFVPMFLVVFVVSIALYIAALFLIVSYAQEKPATVETAATAEKPTFTYVGVDKCKVCHKAESRGNQYGIWASSAHAEAYTTLATDKAKEIARTQKDMKDPQKDERCLKCHVTGFGVDAKLIEAGFRVEEGVQCEACHGAGSGYKTLKIMKALSNGTQDPAEVGMVVPDEKTCVKCHNEESPSYRKFDFKTFYEKIAHPLPKKEAK